MPGRLRPWCKHQSSSYYSARLSSTYILVVEFTWPRRPQSKSPTRWRTIRLRERLTAQAQFIGAWYIRPLRLSCKRRQYRPAHRDIAAPGFAGEDKKTFGCGSLLASFSLRQRPGSNFNQAAPGISRAKTQYCVMAYCKCSHTIPRMPPSNLSFPRETALTLHVLSPIAPYRFGISQGPRPKRSHQHLIGRF
jgi:hypothetical protein